MTVSPFLIPCLVQLRYEFNVLNPARDKGADGWIGDTAHQTRVSDHNPDSQGRVLAIDIDVTGPWPDNSTLLMFVQFILDRCRSGVETRLEYIIFQGKIYTRDNQWHTSTYTGTDQHTNHAHFSARHDHVGQNVTTSWNIEEVVMPTPAEYAQAVANKLFADLGNANSGLYAQIMDEDGPLALAFALKLNEDLANPNSGIFKNLTKLITDVAKTV